MARKPKKPDTRLTVKRYWEQVILFGGMPWTRRKVVFYLTDAGCPKRVLDWWMIGAEVLVDVDPAFVDLEEDAYFALCAERTTQEDIDQQQAFYDALRALPLAHREALADALEATRARRLALRYTERWQNADPILDSMARFVRAACN